MDTYIGYYKSPIGLLKIQAKDDKITDLFFTDQLSTDEKTCPVIELCKKELSDYFAGRLQNFTVNCSLSGTDFQNKVWLALSGLEFGKTYSYADLAEKIGNEKAVRAVGGANRVNKICIIIPCHRVIGKNGSLTGYAAGISRKEWLINHEKAVLNSVLG